MVEPGQGTVKGTLLLDKKLCYELKDGRIVKAPAQKGLVWTGTRFVEQFIERGNHATTPSSDLAESN